MLLIIYCLLACIIVLYENFNLPSNTYKLLINNQKLVDYFRNYFILYSSYYYSGNTYHDVYYNRIYNRDNKEWKSSDGYDGQQPSGAGSKLTWCARWNFCPANQLIALNQTERIIWSGRHEVQVISLRHLRLV